MVYWLAAVGWIVIIKVICNARNVVHKLESEAKAIFQPV